MSPSQKLVAVPGTFACSNFSYMPLANSSRSVIAKLRAYFQWAKLDPKVVGICPCEYLSPPPLKCCVKPARHPKSSPCYLLAFSRCV